MVNVIAEIGINHNGDIDKCLEMIHSAKDCGADFVKFQKRDPDVCVPEIQKSQPKSTPWGDMTYLQYKHKIEFGYSDYKIIDKYCKHIDIGWFVSVWDHNSLKFMHENFRNDIVKIPSAKATELELIKQAKDLYKKVIVSTGMTTRTEINNICSLFNSAIDRNKLVLMHTVSSYPAELDTLRMDTLDWMKSAHSGYSYGYSSHEQNVISASASVYKGISWLERHFTLDKEMWGTDQGASSDPQEMSELIGTIRMLEKTLGVREGVLDCEKDNLRKMR